jgi:hypothetical protein
MKNNGHWHATGILTLLSGLVICASGCGPTSRHPGPIGGVGDFLQDTPGAVFVLAVIVVAIGNALKKK